MRFQLIVRFAHLDYDVRMKTLRRRRSKNQNGGRSPIENKQLHFRD